VAPPRSIPGIVIVQVNEITGQLPRVDIPGSWVDFIVQADKPYYIEPLFTRDPRHINEVHILMAMMVIRGIYEKHQVTALDHGIGFDTGKDGSMRSNRVLCQLAGLYATDLFIGSTLQIDGDANSSTVTLGRLAGFGGAPNMEAGSPEVVADRAGQLASLPGWNAPALEDAKRGQPVQVVLLLETGGVRLQEANLGLEVIAEINSSLLALRRHVPVVGVIAGMIGCFGGMSITASLCSYLIMTREARLGLNGPEVSKNSRESKSSIRKIGN
jgi:hypothetical protein